MLATSAARQSKSFFSEEKKQKTFASALVDRYRTWPDSWEMLKEIKVFCFFSSEKKDFLAFLRSDQPGLGDRGGDEAGE
jgi:hypothetical protein